MLSEGLVAGAAERGREDRQRTAGDLGLPTRELHPDDLGDENGDSGSPGDGLHRLLRVAAGVAGGQPCAEPAEDTNVTQKRVVGTGEAQTKGGLVRTVLHLGASGDVREAGNTGCPAKGPSVEVHHGGLAPASLEAKPSRKESLRKKRTTRSEKRLKNSG